MRAGGEEEEQCQRAGAQERGSGERRCGFARRKQLCEREAIDFSRRIAADARADVVANAIGRVQNLRRRDDEVAAMRCASLDLERRVRACGRGAAVRDERGEAGQRDRHRDCRDRSPAQTPRQEDDAG